MHGVSRTAFGRKTQKGEQQWILDTYTKPLPDWLVRVAAMRDPVVQQLLPELGKPMNATNEKARRVLGWAPCSTEEAIVATAESLVRLGPLMDGQKK